MVDNWEFHLMNLYLFIFVLHGRPWVGVQEGQTYSEQADFKEKLKRETSIYIFIKSYINIYKHVERRIRKLCTSRYNEPHAYIQEVQIQ